MAEFETGILKGVVTDILVAAGAPHGGAMEVARSLVLSNRMGHDSPGIMLLSYYMTTEDRGSSQPVRRVVAGEGIGGNVTY